MSFTAGSVNNLTVTSLETRSESQVTLQLPTNSSLMTGAAIVANNRIVVGGLYNVAEDAAAQPFLAYADLSGRVSSLIDLETFVPIQVCSTNDGTVWVLGQDLLKEGQFWRAGNDTSKVTPADDYDLLRAYSPTGKLLESHFSRKDLRTSSSWFVNLVQRNSVTLVCGNESIGAYIASPAESLSQPTWYEMSRLNGLVQKWNVFGAPSSADLSGLALPYANSLYASFRSNQRAAGVAGIYTLTLGNNGVAQWVVSTVQADPQKNAGVARLKLLGSEGDQLVYVNGSSPGGAPSVTGQNQSPAPIVAWSMATRSTVLSSSLEIPETVAPATNKTVLPTEAGNVQSNVDGADGFVKQYKAKQATTSLTLCYSAACTTAMANLNAALSTWKSSKDKKSRTVALAVATKENITAAVTALNSAFAAETFKAPPPPPPPCRGCKPYDPAPTTSTSGIWASPTELEMIDVQAQGQAQLIAQWQEQLIGQYCGDPRKTGYFLKAVAHINGFLQVATQQECRDSANAKYSAAQQACSVLLAGTAAPNIYAKAAAILVFFACNIASYNIWKNNYNACPPDTADCTQDSDYYDALFKRGPTPARPQLPMRPEDEWLMVPGLQIT